MCVADSVCRSARAEMRTRRIVRSQRLRQIVQAAVVATMALFLVVAASGCSAAAPEVDQVASDPFSDGAENVRLVGYNDLQGRQSL